MRRFLAMAACAALTSGCGGSEQKPTISFGAALSTTGDLANIGQEQVDGASLAIEEINAAGGILGSKLELVVRDDGTDEAKGRTAAQALVDADVPVVIGAVGSAISLAVNQVLAPAGIPQISASSTSPLLTTAADQGTLFRTCASDALQGKLVANRAKAKSFSRVAVLYIPGAYGAGLAGAFESAFTEGGGTVTMSREYVEGESSYSAVLTEVMATDPQAILLVAYPVDGAQIIKDYVAGFSARGITWFFTDAVQDAAFVTAVGGSNFSFSHEGTGPGTPTGSDYEAFVAAFTARYGTAPAPGSFSVQAYDAVYLAALAMVAGGSADAASVKENLGKVSAGGKAFSPRQFAEAVAEIQAGGDVDFAGASGNVDMDASGDVVAPYDLWKVSNSAITITEQGVNP